MRSTEILSRIGQDFSRIFFNNATSLEVLNDPKIKEPAMTTREIQDKLSRTENFLRQDLSDSLSISRDLVTLLHLAIKDFPVSKQEIDDVTELIQPEELNELPRPLQPPEREMSCSETEATNEFFSQVNTNQVRNGVHDDGKTISGLYPYDWKRERGNLNHE
jgi:hypothetical protein